MVEFVGLGVLYRVDNDMRVVMFNDATVLQDDATLDSFFRVLGRFDFHLKIGRGRALVFVSLRLGHQIWAQ